MLTVVTGLVLQSVIEDQPLQHIPASIEENENSEDGTKKVIRKKHSILTDPDSAGERIRTYLTRRFPNAKHAFVPCEEATANDDIGIEQASPEAIRKALAKVRTMNWKPSDEFSATDLILNRLNGFANSGVRRAKLGAILGIGFANAKTFLRRLNNYGITRDEFNQALAKLNSENDINEVENK